MRQTLDAILPHLNRGDAPDCKWPDAKGEYWALCPFHQDAHATNFSVSERGYKCFACGARGGLAQLAQHLGVAVRNPRHHGPAVRNPGLTLPQYATAKRLPPDFLRSLGVEETQGRYGPYLVMPYRDEAGQVVATRRRYSLQGKKRFAWQKGSRPILYGLWRLPEMRRAGWVLLVEGESDCHTAWHYGLPALGVPGASAWKREWAVHLDGLSLYVWREPDKGGATLAQAVGRSLPCHVLRPPEGIKDLSQAHCQGMDVPALVQEMKARAETLTPSASAGEPEATPLDVAEALQKDYGHADRLSAHFRNRFRWATHLGAWMEWTGQVWRPVPEERVAKVASDVLRAQYAAELAAAERSDIDRLAAALRDACTYSRIVGALAFLKGWDGVLTQPEEWDAASWVLNVSNGLLDLRTGELRAHSPDDLCTKLAPVEYDPEARGERWQSHLDRFLPDREVQRQVQRDLGLSLVAATLEESLSIWYGTGANGKTTTARALQAVLADYAKRAAPNLLVASRNERHPTELADLCGARLVFSVEVDEGKKLAEALVKDLTGGDRKKARLMRQDFFEFEQTFSIILIVNHKPIITGTDEGIWRRVRLIPWQVRIPEGERRPQDEVVAELVEDGSGILNWLLAGLRDWQRDRHWVAPEVQAATEAYRAEQDVLGEFLRECCELGPRYTVPVSELYETYAVWCAEAGEEPIGKVKFGGLLRQRGVSQRRAGHGGPRRWVGIRLQAYGDKLQDARVTNGDKLAVSPLKRSDFGNEPEHLSPNVTTSARRQLTEDEQYYLALAEEGA